MASPRMPVVFVGHGSPLNAVQDNTWSRGFRALAHAVPMPRAILAVSAHWLTRGTFVTQGDAPRTIHDFSGFPEELERIRYPAPGDEALCRHVRLLLGGERGEGHDAWGLDHGTWSVLRWMYPRADIPVVQLSLDERLDPAGHLELGRRLAPLRDDGTLLLASGNIVHNLRDAFGRARAGRADAPDWALRFDGLVARTIEAADADSLAALWPGAEDAMQAHPTAEHFLPLLYAAGAAGPEDAARFPVEGFDMGSLSMRAVIWSAPA